MITEEGAPKYMTGADRFAVDEANRKRVTEDLKTAKNLGLIRVVVSRVVMKGDGRACSSRDISKFTEGGLSLAEKALKGRAITHGEA